MIDTAAAYGAGDSERLVGELVGRLGRREDVVIATKAGFVIRNGKRIVDTSRRALLRDLTGSLRRLTTDYVDIWQIHAWGTAPLDESLSAVDHAVSSGMARYAGVSNFVGWQTAQAATWQRAYQGGPRSSAPKSSTPCWPDGRRWKCSPQSRRSAWVSSRGHR